ncbi:CopG family transcriptional regulator [Duganella sp. FT80W]|uniref:CopG family transcriptional regulator n=1 Tax=Duganella guangzhouensis TaxID=2666084 RepID=A0A6I2KU45_9BURK|nr:BrnA antitoxin family protein [Duganella guangzhouensis]MRW89495.1 CopG family transcriptional regulator [Duganella guangzhouensis]
MRKEYDFSKGWRGAVLSTKGKTQVSVYLDDDVYAFYLSKAESLGRGYQGLINEVLKTAMLQNQIPPR